MRKFLEILMKRWYAEGISIVPPYDEALIRSTFLEAGIEPADDLIALYNTVGGMDDDDENLWRLWSLPEIEARKDEANNFGLLFSDYLIESWAYRVKPNDTQTSAVYVDYFDGKTSLLVAPSLEQFFSMYVENADRLLSRSA